MDTAQILTDGAVLRQGHSVVDIELDGDLGLFFASRTGGMLDTDRAEFDSREQRDEALLNTVGLFVKQGWQLAEEA